MSQYRTGTVQTTLGQNSIVGSGTTFVGNVLAGQIFTVVGDNVWYQVSAVPDNTHLTLAANYAGSSGSGKAYAVTTSFTANLSLPYPEQGDLETASLVKRALTMLDALLGKGTYLVPLRIGTFYVWVEVSTGKMRIKATAPASDSDGTVVGSQS